MNHLEITLDNHRTSYKPGEIMQGRVRWNLEKPPTNLEVRLVWTTRGRGNTDSNIEAILPLAPGGSFGGSAAMGDAPFRFVLPAAPHSFRGTLISLVWSVEVTAIPSQTEAQIEFTLSPDGAPIQLKSVDKPGDIGAQIGRNLSQRFGGASPSSSARP